ncbi:hypothetical protein HETIRDRAFT_427250 [Heterobasidion irregulare TC 32-1]|uniref:Uncharacterized protein n=1 Tax=Heterobasidion irregulare (strain TC 32-1) TaxID=747525 RepID=W4KAI8_HETIT|nr:uncharacterized protein HETIRDRAFT_427250 [Heterobasidion irregulare TC 32-1]ETW82101.1 hypothetical protein HETIRDRAFT_427250 [Heterobasidion irregulare TC 32-1]
MFSSLLLWFLKSLAALLLLVWSIGYYSFEPIGSQCQVATETFTTCFLVAPLEGPILKLRPPGQATEPIQCWICVISFPFLLCWRHLSTTPALCSPNPCHASTTSLQLPMHSPCQPVQMTRRGPESSEGTPTRLMTTTDCHLLSLHSLSSVSTKRTYEPIMALKRTWTAEETKRIKSEQEREGLRELRAWGTTHTTHKH